MRKPWRRCVKSGILLMTGAVLLNACQPKADFAELPPPELGMAVSPQNTVVWAGIYRGHLPCPNCDYIDTRLELFPDGQYRFNSRYVGRIAGELPREIVGQFRWQADGLLRLDSAGDDMVFFADGKQLQMRGTDGQIHPDGQGKTYSLIK